MDDRPVESGDPPMVPAAAFIACVTDGRSDERGLGRVYHRARDAQRRDGAAS